MTEAAPQTVVVAALTYKRPDMLAQLLESLLTLERPPGWDVRFLIVDNDADASARPVVESFASLFGAHRLDYAVEPEPGIPAARNRALDEAMSAGARLLCFIDDDEFPEVSWLQELVAHHGATGAVLIGGPVVSVMPDYATTPWQRFMARSLVARTHAMHRRSARRARKGEVNLVATGNWLGDLVWLGAQRLRFDPDLRVSGGSDAGLFNAVLSRGGKVSWCEKAVAYEHIASERLSLRYHFTRAAAQGAVLARLRPTSPVRMCLYQSARMLIGAGLIVVPVQGRASFAAGTRMLGHSFGWFSGMFGTQSKLYERSDSEAKARATDQPHEN